MRFPSSDASKFSTGTPLYTNDLSLNGEAVTSVQYQGSNVLVCVFAGYSNSGGNNQ